MKVWLYYRLSRDEDAELNSLNNQRNILVEYANANNHEIVGESYDDNVSGMHFNREGINKIYEEVEKKSFETILVKDMSRLGRHKTQTAIFIDYLRENGINVVSVTENLDTGNESDDLIIGFKGLPLRYNNDKQKKPLFSRGLSVCRLLFNSFSKLKIDENYKEKRRLFY